MRTESNHARGTFQQLRVALLGGLTCKLLSLYYQVESIKSELEVCTPVSLSTTPSLTLSQLEVDKQQLNTESGVSTLVPYPADGKHVSVSWYILGCSLTMACSDTAAGMNDVRVDAPILPLPATAVTARRSLDH